MTAASGAMTVDSPAMQSVASRHKTPSPITLDPLVLRTAVLAEDDDTGVARNLSMDDLLGYMKGLYDTQSSSFRDSTKGFNTTVATSQALALLQLTGLQSYVFGASEKTKIWDRLMDGRTDEGGFRVHSSVDEASVIGTYGALVAGQLLDRGFSLKQIKNSVENYLLSHYNDTLGGFVESYDSTDQVDVVRTTYHAVHGLDALGYSFTVAQVDAISGMLDGMWDNTDKLFVPHEDSTDSSVLTSFYAITTMRFLNKSQPIPAANWDKYKTGLATSVTSLQDTTGGVDDGAVVVPGFDPNVVDTGSALALLYTIDELGTLNLTAADQFLLRSQLLTDEEVLGVGGFSYNNSTHNSTKTQVQLRYSYFSVLGLYASGYVTNNTEVLVSTSFNRLGQYSDRTNEVVVGNFESEIYSQVQLLDFRSYQNLTIDVQVSNWDVRYNRSVSVVEGEGTEFAFRIYNTTDYNWTLGEHLLEGSYAIRNFTTIPTQLVAFEDSLNVRLPFYNSLNGSSSALTAQPGDHIRGVAIFDNDTVYKANLNYTVYGNLSVNLVFPNGTQVDLNTTSSFNVTENITYPFVLDLANDTYLYNFTIPDDAPLGDYYINLTHTNSSDGSVLTYTTHQFEVRTGLELLALTHSAGEDLVLYPSESYDLNLTIAYLNGNMSAGVDQAYAHFTEVETNARLFTVHLVQIGGTAFQTNTTETVPVRLLMGDYNVTVEVVWNSTTTEGTFNSTVTNATLPTVEVGGYPVLDNITLRPSNTRGNQEIYAGDMINLTADLAVGTYAGGPVSDLNRTVKVTAQLLNSSSSNVVQTLFVNQPNTTKLMVYNEVDPNLLQWGNLAANLKLQVQLESSGEFVPFHTNDGAVYNPSLDLRKSTLTIDENTLTFLPEESPIELGSTTAIVANFKVYSTVNQVNVSYLDLKGNLTLASAGVNQSDVTLPAIVALESAEYQLQIPTTGLEAGVHTVTVYTSIGSTEVGSFTFELVEVVTDDSIPAENFAAVGGVFLALVVTSLVYVLTKRAVSKPSTPKHSQPKSKTENGENTS